jgi:MFS-type transporter involved in bile tolerance (Atg22 family)
MIEILLLVALTRKIGRICEEKGRRAGGFKALTVVLWFGGEIVGAVIAAASGVEDLGVYLFALIGAAVGAGISVLIANNLTPVETDKFPSSSSEDFAVNAPDEEFNKKNGW